MQDLDQNNGQTQGEIKPILRCS